jgi:Tfp pilus assembly protein PilO
MNRDALILIALVTCTIIGYDYFYNYQNRQRNLQGQRAMMEKYQKDSLDAAGSKAKLPKLKTEQEATQKRVASLSALLPKRHMGGALLNTITSVAPPEIRFDSVSPRPIKEKTERFGDGAVTYAEFEFKLDFKCPFPFLGEFLEKLEKNQFLFDIHHISMRHNPQDQDLAVTMSVKTYCLDAKK